ncbi:MAG: pyrophosphate--fructose-6-phosphate 1-phosphotransferase [Nitrospinae bacterium RIFCSPLOWO2_02_FULL_39_110]|nr:MAG: pyrophosphate--fructose-6-phosphate 1-phosphotransferase [Nitrospinae bacterium RIFCSPHIGHO2_02_39_11]OGW00737.1 MAG: pyrophosphate--fructose-6-phosphate 1-phosphotransferase [Nitrospinae bacterium RIFCSPHIGHO2_02_FULL_39_82]OGW00755.1 MAG: pyrophosphate--fructose-6-phosphate 1-phosphotransferase [Nitrospinae bacterium RIFCSPHIGHO2_12_FULL_39_42]OGW03935.1 MAG: pyrophosphate--fructose-6-phosphate 1-phosphotransferase [Nitrospinae bacterium RIFCSPLOWO2_02_FULL_39_110]OGW06004.1 MAG: pyro
MKIGILTGGGDCPGENAVIRAVVKRGYKYGYSIIGIKRGWLGLINGEVEPLTNFSVSGILPKGGTILGTSRSNPFKKEDDVQRVMSNIKKFGFDTLITIGGEDTLSVAKKFYEMGVKVVGIPKTIDNDLSGTDYTFGFDTAVNIVTEAIDRLHTTAESHDRVMVIEVMGRHAGWIATVAGIAGGADCILIPEKPFEIEKICKLVKSRHKRGRGFSIIVVAEGAVPTKETKFVTMDESVDAFGHVKLGGVGNVIGKEIEKITGFETRVTILGHIQRGGSPTAFDRVLATRYGVAAVDLINNGEFGKMVALRGNAVISVPLEEAVAKLKTVDLGLYDIAEIFFG